MIILFYFDCVSVCSFGYFYIKISIFDYDGVFRFNIGFLNGVFNYVGMWF